MFNYCVHTSHSKSSCNRELYLNHLFIDNLLYNSSLDIAISLYLDCNIINVLIQDIVIKSMIMTNYIRQEDIIRIYNSDYIPIACLN